ncbi:phosphatases II [Piromyces finnis]|uniref:Protein tyrosine phosphatase type IVA 3 n=1 Tax=Piromyces finnis TaxID=1754191 RepID=A0A1Y1VAH2_9FUNG|nr:phosphatases II [Piromyces finnis]|eukprot:ORX50376.1 phosphatases II [Piromyces finnis]
MEHSAYSHKYSVISHKKVPINLVILDCPSDENIDEYINILKDNNVNKVIRICETRFYNATSFEKEGIQVIDDIKFEDGTTPDSKQVKLWREIIDKTIKETGKEQTPAIAVHCVSGIGRAPVMVAITLIDYGIDSLDAVEFIRKNRRGAINKKQLTWLSDSLKKKKKSFFKKLF